LNERTLGSQESDAVDAEGRLESAGG
jgi:hypothetical protein